MKKHGYFPSADGITRIHYIEWIPEGEVRAVLQLCHGMVEFIERYDRFAEFLCGQGFYVVGNDHLGHGESVASEDKYGYFGHPDGNKYLIKDLNRLRKITQKKYPDIPYFMLGHSMGSFLIRQYMMIYGVGLSGVIVMGTGSQPGGMLCFGKVLCRLTAPVIGWDKPNKLINAIVSSANNKRIEHVKTPSDWLTKDETIVNAYISNPWDRFIFTTDGFYHLFETIQFIQKPGNINLIPKNLPILLVAGEKDPVGNYGKGVKQVYHVLEKAGIKDLNMKLYPEDRHEILNELDYKTVYQDLLEWLETIMNQ